MLEGLIRRGAGVLGYEVRRRAASAFDRQKALLRGSPKPVIFDVGAHVGDLTLRYHQLFPGAAIHAFEPFPTAFEELRRRTLGIPAIAVHRLALSDSSGAKVLHINTDSTCNSLLPRPEGTRRYYPEQAINIEEMTIEALTIDAFCDERGIETIDLLKLDVEGHELSVLKGATSRLAAGSVKVIYSEVMFVPHYEGGVLFHDLGRFLHEFGFRLYDLCDLKRAQDGQIRWGNAVFSRI